MPRFFVQLIVDTDVDRIALEFPSQQAAIEDASRARHDIMREEARDCRIQISDHQGRVIATLPNQKISLLRNGSEQPAT